MSISIGTGTQGAGKRCLRLTLSGGDARRAQALWGGERPRLSYVAEALGDGRWSLVFAADPKGNIAAIHPLPGKGGEKTDYLCWTWSLDENELAGMPSVRAKAHRGEYLNWETDLEIVVRGERKRQVARRAAPVPIVAPGPVLELVHDVASRRLGALRVAVNQAIEELAARGIRVRVDQSEAGEPTAFTIQL